MENIIFEVLGGVFGHRPKTGVWIVPCDVREHAMTS